MYYNYNKIYNAIAERVTFNGNSARAEREGYSYKIYSYKTLIYESKLNEPDFFDISFYSVTTSRLQNFIASIIYGKTIKQLRKEAKKKEEAEATLF